MKKMNMMRERSLIDVYTYQKQALDLLNKDHPHYDEIKDLLLDQVSDEIHTIYNSNWWANSIREGIYQIQPGELLEIKFSYNPKNMNFSDLKKYKWFDSKNLFIVNEKNKYKESEVLKKTEDLIINSINNQSLSKVPIGTFLSGGIDSTLITALLQKNSNQSINSFTISLPDNSSKNFNEGHYAKKIAKHLGTNHTEINISEDHIFNIMYYI